MKLDDLNLSSSRMRLASRGMAAVEDASRIYLGVCAAINLVLESIEYCQVIIHTQIYSMNRSA